MTRRSALTVFAVGVAIIALIVVWLRSRGTAVAEAPSGGGSRPSSSVVDQPGGQARVTKKMQGVRARQQLASRIAGFNSEMASCFVNALCPEGTFCWGMPGEPVACFASDCRGVDDTSSCGQGRACRVFYDDGITTFHRCAVAGTAKVGEVCSIRPVAKQRACAGGLACWNGRCRKPCTSDSSCSGREKCLSVSRSDKACIDDACTADSDCPNGSICLQTLIDGSETKSCVRITAWPDGTPSCRVGGCPKGMGCDIDFQGDRYLARCRPTCSVVPSSSCPDGFVCAAAQGHGLSESPSMCYKKCNLFTPGSSDCDQGEKCTTTPSLGEDGAGCRPPIGDDGPVDLDLAPHLTNPVGRPREP